MDLRNGNERVELNEEVYDDSLTVLYVRTELYVRTVREGDVRAFVHTTCTTKMVSSSSSSSSK